MGERRWNQLVAAHSLSLHFEFCISHYTPYNSASHFSPSSDGGAM
jgi:hypothetical protein